MNGELLSIETAQKLARMDKAIENLEKSIVAIDEKIKNQDYGENYINDYRKARLRAIRMKCKEILDILRGEDNENK